MTRLQVVVLTYNRSDALLAVLRALAPQCGRDDLVVVADDGSRPEHVQALAAGAPRFDGPLLHVWHADVGFTAARARNLGVAHGSGDYLVFLDGDCIPGPDFLAQHRALAQSRCFVNGSRVLLSERLSARVTARQVDLAALTRAQWMRLRLARDVNKLTHLVRLPVAARPTHARFEWKGIRSCNFALARSDFYAVNGFDETFNGWGHEDADLVLRLHHLGLKRKNGFLATEVFHLWHRENSRADEDVNRQRVHRRSHTGIVRAELGLAEMTSAKEVVVRELN